jgi:hypothetical protein
MNERGRQLECCERCDVRPEHLELEACVASVLAHLELQGVCFNARVRSHLRSYP